MKKDDFIKEWQSAAGRRNGKEWSKEQHGILLAALCEVAAAELLGGGEISLPGLGKLKSVSTKARLGRNPRTGEVLEIPAGRKVVFMPGQEFKASLKG